MLNLFGSKKTLCDGMTRRDMLRVGALAVGGLTLTDLLRAEQAAGKKSAKSVIMVYMCGAPGHQDMYDLKMNAPAEIRGEFRPIPTNVPGVEICEHMPRMAAIMDKLVPLRSVYGSPDGDHDSFICYTGRSKRQQPPGGWPSVGSTISKVLGPQQVGAVVRGLVAGHRASAVRLAGVARLLGSFSRRVPPVGARASGHGAQWN